MKILALYIKSDKRLGSQKMSKCLAREYRIHISSGRVYRLMKTMNLPKMSTVKPPKQKAHPKDEGGRCKNLLQQLFKPEKPNMAWVCDFYLSQSRWSILLSLCDHGAILPQNHSISSVNPNQHRPCHCNAGGCYSSTRRVFRRDVSYGSEQSVYSKAIPAVSGSAWYDPVVFCQRISLR